MSNYKYWKNNLDIYSFFYIFSYFKLYQEPNAFLPNDLIYFLFLFLWFSVNTKIWKYFFIFIWEYIFCLSIINFTVNPKLKLYFVLKNRISSFKIGISVL